jgi:hypothetical protein
MLTYPNRLVGLLALALCVFASGICPVCAQPPARPKERAASSGCQAPEQAFAAAKQALTRGDWKGYFSLCEEETATASTGQLVAWYAMKFLASGEALRSQPIEEKRDFARLEKVLNKHGVTDADCRRFLEDQPGFPELDFTRPWFRRIKDKPRFNAEMIAAMQSQHDYWEEGQKQFDGARLDGLEIKGSQATAAIRFADGHKEKIAFRRVKGAWLLHFPVQDPSDGYLKAAPQR